jgi:hypothetical protein
VKVVAYVPDLMDRSKLSGAADVDVTFVARPADLPGAATSSGAQVAVVDLMRPGVLDVVGLVPVPVIGFANHAERDLMDRALAAGCRRVLARSAFFSRLPELLAT